MTPRFAPPLSQMTLATRAIATTLGQPSSFRYSTAHRGLPVGVSGAAGASGAASGGAGGSPGGGTATGGAGGGRAGSPVVLFRITGFACFSSASQVYGPTMPSTVNPLAFWKSSTAFLVFGPKSPSTFTPLLSMVWSFLTHRPCDPSWSFGGSAAGGRLAAA